MVQDGILHEDEPLELLEGDIVLVSPQGPLHAAHLTEIHGRLTSAYHGLGHVRNRLPLDLRPHNLPEPDLAVVRGLPRAYRERHPNGKDAWLVIEIAQTSQDLDRRKGIIDAAAGVDCYWLIDLPQGRVEIYADGAEMGGDRRPLVLGRGDEVELPGLGLRWSVGELVG